MPTLNSSAILAADYDPQTRVLTIVFTSGGKAYSFYDVPESVYRGLVNAASPGSYYSANIRGRYG